jgi:hypothetical protein
LQQEYGKNITFSEKVGYVEFDFKKFGIVTPEKVRGGHHFLFSGPLSGQKINQVTLFSKRFLHCR